MSVRARRGGGGSLSDLSSGRADATVAMTAKELVDVVNNNMLLSQQQERRQDQDFPGSVVVVDLAKGEYVKATLGANVTSLTFANWLNAPLASRATLEIVNPGTYTLDFGSIKWPEGIAPTITHNGTDLVELTSTDGGATIFGRIWQDLK